MGAFIFSVWLANYFIGHVGTACVPGGPCLIPVWFGVVAPSGVLVIGLSFTLRDLVQRHLNARWSIMGILVGAMLSAILSPRIALASGTAFLFSELLDLFVYTPLQRRNLYLATVASNAVGLVVDSIIFLGMAFGSLQFISGQIIGKAWMTVLAVPLISGIRKWEAGRGVR